MYTKSRVRSPYGLSKAAQLGCTRRALGAGNGRMDGKAFSARA